jgi:hypothetical protein
VVHPRAVARVLACAVVFLVTASLAGQVSKYVFGHDHLLGLVSLFNVDGEGNVPTWYSAVTLLACSALLGIIGSLHRRDRQSWAAHWLGLSGIFLYLATDEAAFIHELLNPVFRTRLHLPSYLYYSWAVIAAPLLLVIGLAYLRFLVALPRRFTAWFAAAGLVYVGGALGVEMLGAAYTVARGTENLGYALVATVEEAMEMAGVAMFIYALLEYLAATFGAIRLEFSPRSDPRTVA